MAGVAEWLCWLESCAENCGENCADRLITLRPMGVSWYKICQFKRHRRQHSYTRTIEPLSEGQGGDPAPDRRECPSVFRLRGCEGPRASSDRTPACDLIREKDGQGVVVLLKTP